MDNYEPDALDRRILTVLSREGNLSHAALGQRCGVTRQTAAFRVRRLERTGVIDGYRASIDLEKLGKRTSFILFLKLDLSQPDASSGFIKKARADPRVLADFAVTGDWDVVQILALPSVRAYEEYVGELWSELGRYIKDVQGNVILNFYKHFDEHVPF